MLVCFEKSEERRSARQLHRIAVETFDAPHDLFDRCSSTHSRGAALSSEYVVDGLDEAWIPCALAWGAFACSGRPLLSERFKPTLHGARGDSST
ncbi:hypothetical protein D3C73_1518170 [compost metagenome]